MTYVGASSGDGRRILRTEPRKRTDHSAGDVAGRVILAEDETLLREGLVRLRAEEGHDVVAAVGDGKKRPQNTSPTWSSPTF
nr:hypothetical protein [Amycolatopsis rubida]